MIMMNLGKRCTEKRTCVIKGGHERSIRRRPEDDTVQCLPFPIRSVMIHIQYSHTCSFFPSVIQVIAIHAELQSPQNDSFSNFDAMLREEVSYIAAVSYVERIEVEVLLELSDKLKNQIQSSPLNEIE